MMRHLTATQSRVRAEVLAQLDHAAELLEAADAVRALGHYRLGDEVDRLVALAHEQETDARYRAGCAGLDAADL